MKLLGILLALVLVVSMVVVGCAAPAPSPAPTPAPAPAPAKPIELKFAHNQPPTHYIHTQTFVPWAAEIEKRTGGKVKLTLIPAGQLGPPNEAYDLIVKGTVDMGMVIPGLVPGRFPLNDASHMPFVIPPPGDPSRAAILKVFFDKYQNPLYFNKDVKMLWTGFFSGIDLLMAKKPARTPDDLKGVVIGVPSKAVADLVKAAGGSPESVPTPEIYTALERGVIDGQTQSIETLVSLKLMDLVKYVTLLGSVGVGSFMNAANQKSWNSLSPDVQKTIEDLNPWVYDLWVKVSYDALQNAKATAAKAGKEIYELTPEFRAKWVEVGRPVEEAWSKDLDSKGLPASQMIKEMRAVQGK